jgi:uncharacterized protein (DUF305 family)
MMTDIVKFVRYLGFILLVAASFSMTTQAATESENIAKDGMTEMQMQNGTDKAHDMKQTMQAGMEAMASMETTGDTDKDFAMMMKVHHQQALDMANMELLHGKSPVMKAMAKKIITAQKREIAQFDSWLAKQK